MNQNYWNEPVLYSFVMLKHVEEQLQKLLDELSPNKGEKQKDVSFL